MPSIIERIYFLQQTSRALAALVVIALIVIGVSLLSLKLLGVLMAAAGLAAMIWFPGLTTHQSPAFTDFMIKFGAALILVGLLLIWLG
jgi:predicted phage tail protein